MANLELLKFNQMFAKEIVEQVFGTTLWNPKLTTENDKMMWDLASLSRPPFAAQVENGILPLVKGLQEYKFGLLIAEMGTGKTQMSFSAAYLLVKNSKRRKLCFLTSGGKHIPKMIREAEAIYGDKAIVKTIVNKTPSEKVGKNEVRPEEVEEMVAPEGKILIFILSKDTAKMDLGTDLVFQWGDNCPSCNKMIVQKNFDIISKKWPKNWKLDKAKYMPKIKIYNCPECDASLETRVAKNIWEGEGVFPKRKANAYLKGTRKISIGKKFRHMSKKSGEKIFDLLIVDEVHEMQSGTSLQGKVYRDLVNVSGSAMIMTGTLSNGYPSSVFYILQAIMPAYFKKLGYNFYDVGKFVDHYGARRYTTSKDVIQKKGSKIQVKVNELPKISDRIVSLLAPFTCWLKMEDLNLKMPPYSEEAVIVEMDQDVLESLNEYKTRVCKLLSSYNHKLVKAFAQRFMYLQNNPTLPFVYEFEGDVVNVDTLTGNTSIDKRLFSESFNCFDSGRTFTKEAKLLEIVKKELKMGRNCLVYSIYNGAASISARLNEVLSRDEELKDKEIKVMPEHVSGQDIEPWIEDNVCDVLIASPLKLATGLDLCQYPTIIFYETGTHLRMVQQASRRSWRAVGQDKSVKVYFMAYQGIQAHILDIMAKKMRAAAVVEGKKVIEGQIASVFDDDADFTKALNDIANELEKTFKPDFSTTVVEEGKLRPHTVLEQRFLDILFEITGVNEDDLNSGVEAILEDMEINVEDEDIVVECACESLSKETDTDIVEVTEVKEKKKRVQKSLF